MTGYVLRVRGINTGQVYYLSTRGRLVRTGRVKVFESVARVEGAASTLKLSRGMMWLSYNAEFAAVPVEQIGNHKIAPVKNPSGYARARESYARELDAAADKYENFTGFPATKETTFKKRALRSGFALGDLVAVTYAQNRGHGGVQHYEHEFKKSSRPLLVASTDGKQIDIVGGQYRVTNRGIEDT